MLAWCFMLQISFKPLIFGPKWVPPCLWTRCPYGSDVDCCKAYCRRESIAEEKSHFLLPTWRRGQERCQQTTKGLPISDGSGQKLLCSSFPQCNLPRLGQNRPWTSYYSLKSIHNPDRRSISSLHDSSSRNRCEFYRMCFS